MTRYDLRNCLFMFRASNNANLRERNSCIVSKVICDREEWFSEVDVKSTGKAYFLLLRG